MRAAFIVLVCAVLAACAKIEEQLFEFGLDVERTRAGLEVRTVEFDGYKIAYLERTGPGETIVLLHGFASEKDAWVRFIRYLPEAYRVIALDLPGHGQSTRRPGHTYDVLYLTERVAAALDAIGVDRFHIAGNSLGGIVALVYTLAHPERVRTLGLIDAAGVDSPVQSDFERLLEAGDNPLIVDSEEDFARLMRLVFHRPPPTPWPVNSVLLRRYIARAEFHEKMWQDIWSRRQEINSLLPRIEPEVIIMWGEEDRILDPSAAAVFTRGLRSAEVYMLRDTGHSPMMERPWRSATLYRDFLFRHSGRESAGSAGG